MLYCKPWVTFQTRQTLLQFSKNYMNIQKKYQNYKTENMKCHHVLSVPKKVYPFVANYHSDCHDDHIDHPDDRHDSSGNLISLNPVSLGFHSFTLKNTK